MPSPTTQETNSNKNIPTGTVTFLFTDIEGSTKLWENYPNEMNLALARHDAILRQAIESNSGYVFKTVGDAFCAAFQTPLAGLQAALAAQRAMLAENWPTFSPIKVRIGLHTGEANERDNDYFGPTLNRLARMFAAGHGGQTLLSAKTTVVLRQQLPPHITLQDMGLHHFKDLNQPEQVFQLVAPDLPNEFAPLKSLELALDNLLDHPASSSQLIGREQELADLSQLLAQAGVRLVTLTGVGGTGKTRLSLSVARLLRNQFAAGVSFVPLETVTQRQSLIKEIATTLKIKEVAGEPLLDTLKTYLRDKQLLLILDNFEQLVEQGATLLPELLKAAPMLKIIVTSREVLQLSQEHEYPVEPLALPQINKPKLLLTATNLASYAAIALFVARAQVVKADFSLTEDNAPLIAQICHKLDGLPLAIELAAARIKILSPTQLLERLSDKLKVLTGGAKDLPARQQTLRGAIDWSYDLLDPQEQSLFRCLAIFAGGCTVESAEAVYTNSRDSKNGLIIDVLDGLTALANKSLLKQREDKNGEIRFMLLPTIREYGLEKLELSSQAVSDQELDRVELEYVKYFVEWSQAIEARLEKAGQLTALAELDNEYDNLREVLERAINRPLAAYYALQLSGTLWQFWTNRSYYSEGRGYLQKSLALSASDRTNKLARVKALNGIGRLDIQQGSYTQAEVYLLESLALGRELGDKLGIANALTNLGIINDWKGDYAQAKTYFEESLALHRELEHKVGIANVLGNLGITADNQGDYAQAKTYFEENLFRVRELGDIKGLAIVLNNCGFFAYAHGDYPQAKIYYEESLALRRELGENRGVALGLSNFSMLLILEGNYQQALDYLEEALNLQQEIGDKWGISYSLVNFILFASEQVHSSSNKTKTAAISNQLKLQYLLWIACLAGAVDNLVTSIKLKLQLPTASEHNKRVSTVLDELGAVEFGIEFAKGQAMAWEEAVEFTFTIRQLYTDNNKKLS